MAVAKVGEEERDRCDEDGDETALLRRDRFRTCLSQRSRVGDGEIGLICQQPKGRKLGRSW